MAATSYGGITHDPLIRHARAARRPAQAGWERVMARREFSVAVKKAAKARAGDHCEECGQPFAGRRAEYDHIQPDGLDGEPTLENCAVLCNPCHTAKTHQQDRPIMAKADRQWKAEAGIKPKGSGFRGWRRFNGELVWRE